MNVKAKSNTLLVHEKSPGVSIKNMASDKLTTAINNTFKIILHIPIHTSTSSI